MTQYTYLFTNLLTGIVLGDTPVNGVTFDRQLNKAGNMQGAINLDNDLIPNVDLLALTQPGRTAMYIYRNDVVVWGGIVWTRSYQSQGKSLQFTAQTFESYAYRRIYRPTKTIKYNEAQCSIVQKLWASLQGVSNANIGISPAPSLPAGDVVRQLTVNPWDFKNYGELIDSITQFDDGCDYYIDIFEEAGMLVRRLTIGYPTLGQTIDYTGLMIDYPGNILNYYWTENVSENNNRYWATGDGDDAAMKVGSATDSRSLSSGYPLLETVESYQGVTVQATINNHAAADLLAGPVQKPKYTFEVKGESLDAIGSYSLGSDVRIRIEDPRFPEGKDITVRMVGWNATPSSADSVEQFTVVLQGQEDA